MQSSTDEVEVAGQLARGESVVVAGDAFGLGHLRPAGFGLPAGVRLDGELDDAANGGPLSPRFDEVGRHLVGYAPPEHRQP